MTQYGRYMLERRIAVGGMAEIMAARLSGPSAFSKRVVIKRMLAHHKNDPEAVDLFLDEARLAARFTHANLVQVYELAEIEGAYCIVMELIDGHDLGQILSECVEQRVKMPPAIAALIIAKAAEALHYVHQLRDDDGRQLQIVHADVSPTNIVITRQGEVKVVDFGIAKHVDTGSTSVIRGKLGYMPPEQLRGDTLDARTDVYALGVVFYELLTSRPLLSRMSQEHVLETLGSEIDFSDKLGRATFPEPLRAIVLRMIGREAGDRVTSAAEVHRAIEAWLSTTERPLNDEVAAFVRSVMGDAEPESPRVPTAIASPASIAAAGGPAEKSKRRGRMIGAVVAAVAALGVVAVVALRPSPTAEPTPVTKLSPVITLAPATLAKADKEVAPDDENEPPAPRRAAPKKSAPPPTKPAAPLAPVVTPVVSAQRGRVTFHVDPWAQVYSDGMLIGTTPMAPITMSAGQHVIELVCPDTQKRKRIQVSVVADKTTKVNEILR